jgi:hypothetical protein
MVLYGVLSYMLMTFKLMVSVDVGFIVVVEIYLLYYCFFVLTFSPGNVFHSLEKLSVAGSATIINNPKMTVEKIEVRTDANLTLVMYG